MNNDEKTILEDIRKMLHPYYPSVDINAETFLEYGDGSHLDMSSLEIIQFIVMIEEKYDIIIDFEDRFYTIGDTVRAIMSYLNDKERT